MALSCPTVFTCSVRALSTPDCTGENCPHVGLCSFQNPSGRMGARPCQLHIRPRPNRSTHERLLICVNALTPFCRRSLDRYSPTMAAAVAGCDLDTAAGPAVGGSRALAIMAHRCAGSRPAARLRLRLRLPSAENERRPRRHRPRGITGQPQVATLA